MAESRQRRVRQLFDHAREKPPAERADFVAREACDDSSIAREVLSLLRFADSTGVGEGASGPPKIDVAALVGRTLIRHRQPEWYSMGGVIGRGGMGEVFRVHDRALERDLAMKVLRPETGAYARFLSEAKITSRLDHPGIVPIHESGVDEDGRLYFTMKLVEGAQFSQILSKVHSDVDGWNTSRAVGVLVKVCETVAFAHSRGVLHRDLKPANVMVGRFGEVYVMDWGLAKEFERNAPSTTPGGGTTDEVEGTLHGAAMGTAQYMPPEQAAGDWKNVGPKADVYAIGAMLYQVLAGNPPYEDVAAGEGALARIMRVQAGPPTPIERLASKDVPVELLAICSKAMQHEIARRYDSADALAADLRAYLEGRPIAARAPRLGYLAAHLLRQYRVQAIAAAVVLTAVAGSGFYVAQTRGEKLLVETEAKRKAQEDAREIATQRATLAQNLERERKQLLAFEEFTVLAASVLDATGVTKNDDMDELAAYQFGANSETPTAFFERCMKLLGDVPESSDVHGHLAAAMGLIGPAIGLTEEQVAILLDAAWTQVARDGVESSRSASLAYLVARAYGYYRSQPDSDAEPKSAPEIRNRERLRRVFEMVDDNPGCLDDMRMSEMRFREAALLASHGDVPGAIELAETEARVRARLLGEQAGPTLWVASIAAWWRFVSGTSEDDALKAEKELQRVVDSDNASGREPTLYSLERQKKLASARYRLSRIGIRDWDETLKEFEALDRRCRYFATAQKNVALLTRFELMNCLARSGRLDQAQAIARELIEAYRRPDGSNPVGELAAQALLWIEGLRPK